MRIKRLALQFRVKLYAHEPRLIRPLHNLRQFPVRAHAREDQPARLQRVVLSASATPFCSLATAAN